LDEVDQIGGRILDPVQLSLALDGGSDRSVGRHLISNLELVAVDRVRQIGPVEVWSRFHGLSEGDGFLEKDISGTYVRSTVAKAGCPNNSSARVSSR
jgi:hypothetical protein